MALAQSFTTLSLANPIQASSILGSSSSSSASPSLSVRSSAFVVSGSISSRAQFAGSFALPWSVQSNGSVLSESSRNGAFLTVRAEAGEQKKVLIVNTNSGGHAVIGFWTAKDLVAAGHSVTILTVGEESSDKMKKQPFSRFGVIFCPLSYLQLHGPWFNHILQLHCLLVSFLFFLSLYRLFILSIYRY
jgi:hypothetical protein